MFRSPLTTAIPALPQELIHKIISHTQDPRGPHWNYFTSASTCCKLMEVSRIFRTITREIWSSSRGFELDYFSDSTHPLFELFKSPYCSYTFPVSLHLHLNLRPQVYRNVVKQAVFSDLGQEAVGHFFRGLEEASPRVRTLYASFGKPKTLRPDHIRTIVRVIQKDVRKVTLTHIRQEWEIMSTWMGELGQCIQLEELEIHFFISHLAMATLPCIQIPGSAPSTLRIMHLSTRLERAWLPLLDWIARGHGRLLTLYIGLSAYPLTPSGSSRLLVSSVLAHPAVGFLKELYIRATPVSLDLSGLPPSVTKIHAPMHLRGLRGDDGDDGNLAAAVGTLASLLNRPHLANVTSISLLTIRLTVNGADSWNEKPALAALIKELDDCLVKLLLCTVSPTQLYFHALINGQGAAEAFMAKLLPGVSKIGVLEGVTPVYEGLCGWTMRKAERTERENV